MPKSNSSKCRLFARILIVLTAFFSSPPPVFGQPSQAVIENWRDPASGVPYSGLARMMGTDLSQNVFVLGDTVVDDYLIIRKYDPSGILLWQKTYDPAERLRGTWLTVDSNGNVIVIATIITGSSSTAAGWLTLKYDTSGNLLWANSLPGAYRAPSRVAVDINDGSIWIPDS